MLAVMRAFALAGCLFLLGLAAPRPPAVARPQHSTQATVPEIPSALADDTYAIYSLLMPGQPFRGMQSGSTTRWAIAAETVNFDDMNPRIDPRGALKPPPDNEKPFHEAVETFLASKYERFRLQQKFHLDQPYDLLDADQVSALRAAKASPDPGSRLRGQYAAYPGVTFFSDVYFDAHRDAALVYMNDWCGALCSQGQWIYLEKHGGHWERMSGITRPGA